MITVFSGNRPPASERPPGTITALVLGIRQYKEGLGVDFLERNAIYWLEPGSDAHKVLTGLIGQEATVKIEGPFNGPSTIVSAWKAMPVPTLPQDYDEDLF